MVMLKDVQYVSEYKVKLLFNDGTEGIVDFHPILTNDTRDPVRELLDLRLFKTCTCDLDTIVWENGVDFAPEYLHTLLKKTAVA